MPPKKRAGRRIKKDQVEPSIEYDSTAASLHSEEEIEMQSSTSKSTKLKKYGTSTSKDKAKPLTAILNMKSKAAKWKQYITAKRSELQEMLQGPAEADETLGVDPADRQQIGGLGLEIELVAKPVEETDELSRADRNRIRTANRNLIEYFAHLGKSTDPYEIVDLDTIQEFLNMGADINCKDTYGQTVLHEVARVWHPDVAEWLIENGSDHNLGDNFGRTPLHVAASTDYPEMIELLINKGANKESITKTEGQTPMHYAAKNDAVRALKALIKNGCEYMVVKDYKQRTPLYIAAELDRSESARFLLELPNPAPVGILDECGQSAVMPMIVKMPSVAKLALDQLHQKDRANRRQYFYLNKLEPGPLEIKKDAYPRTVLQVVVRHRRLDLIEHPVLLNLITLKWKKFGRTGALLNLIVNFMFILLWTLQGVLIEFDKRYEYILPDQWWRLLLFFLALIFTAWQLKDELMEYVSSKRSHARWEKWRLDELDRDVLFCHPRWPEERKYLIREKEETVEQAPQYFSDAWNIFDWVCYTLLLVCVITHIVDIFHHSVGLARWHIRIMAITVILIWIRLLKNAKAFSYLGPFIVMLTHMFGDVVKFTFLYLEFYIPFSCAFWMLFGDTKVPMEYQGREDAANFTIEVQGLETVNALFFTMFRLTLVDEYDYAGMKSIDSLMADVLVGFWLALSAILMLNLFIALLSDTFQRVYDNARANAIMQKAITVLGIEEGMSDAKRDKHKQLIHEKYAPQDIYYDDDLADETESMQKITIQIKDQLDEVQEKLEMGHYSFKRKRGPGKPTTEQTRDKHRNTQPKGTPALPSGGQPPPYNGAEADEDDDDVGEDGVSEEVFNREVSTLRHELASVKSLQQKMNTRLKHILSALTQASQVGGDLALPPMPPMPQGQGTPQPTMRSWSSEVPFRRTASAMSETLPQNDLVLEISDVAVPVSDPPPYYSSSRSSPNQQVGRGESNV